MDINQLTIAQAREIARIFGGIVSSESVSPAPHPFVGKYVILHCYSAGVHAGVLISQVGDQAILHNSRRLWSWTANAGVALSGVAINGLKSGKIDTLVPEIALTGVIETIPCTDAARDSINAA